MATDSPPLRITSPADILAYIPHALGFGPVESLVMVTLSGRTIGATLRVDLPPPGDDPRAFAAGVCSYLCSDEGADATLMVLYTDEGWNAPATPPRRAMADALGQALAAVRMPLKDAWLVSATHWREYFCVDPDCCPWPGRPVTSIEESALSVELIFGGSSVSASAELAVDRALASAPPDRPCAKQSGTASAPTRAPAPGAGSRNLSSLQPLRHGMTTSPGPTPSNRKAGSRHCGLPPGEPYLKGDPGLGARPRLPRV
jgi:hypothetical protein